jgi:hypothetical protein
MFEPNGFRLKGIGSSAMLLRLLQGEMIVELLVSCAEMLQEFLGDHRQER